MEFPIVCKKNQPKAKRSVLAFYVYFNYFVWGSSIILVSQFHSWFMKLWHTDLKGISIVISMLGLGHLITVLLAGWFSDKYSIFSTKFIRK
ncbi:MFS transporter, partial [Lactobacillus salivarius]|nr:MFS transporter [Ligilactobacillus salivarius]